MISVIGELLNRESFVLEFSLHVDNVEDFSIFYPDIFKTTTFYKAIFLKKKLMLCRFRDDISADINVMPFSLPCLIRYSSICFPIPFPRL